MDDVNQSLTRQSVLVAVVAAVLDVAYFCLSGIFEFAPGAAAAFVVLVAAVGLALALPAKFSGAVWICQALTQLGAAVVFHGMPSVPDVTPVGFLIAGYLAGAGLRGWRSAAAVAGTAAVVVGKDLTIGHADIHRPWQMALWVMSGVVVPFLVGRYTAARHAHVADLEHRLQQRRLVELAALDKALAEERSAIARDLHDVISHHVSASGIHAGAGRLALANGNSTATRRALEAVETSSRAAMADLHRQLDLLRGRDLDGRRQPGLANIDDLLDRARHAGLAVDVCINGQAPPLAESLDVALYRIVQELVTNALKHGTGCARLEIRYSPDLVVVHQTNPVLVAPQQEPSWSTRRGLSGIKERVALFGGKVHCQPNSVSSSWQVTIEIPVERQ